jgi:hypothetical protein
VKHELVRIRAGVTAAHILTPKRNATYCGKGRPPWVSIAADERARLCPKCRREYIAAEQMREFVSRPRCACGGPTYEGRCTLCGKEVAR